MEGSWKGAAEVGEGRDVVVALSIVVDMLGKSSWIGMRVVVT
jgi:hypothetical protein